MRGLEGARRRRRPWVRWHRGFLVAAAMSLSAAGALTSVVWSNPVPEREARELNDCPGRWLARPNPDDERRLVFQFATHGVAPSLLSPATIELLATHFDRFAPLIVTAQRPPHYPDQSLQAWYREHAKRAQVDSMTAALRLWLTAELREAPTYKGEQAVGSPDVERSILAARIAAAEALSDWGDTRSLPDLRALQRRVPEPSPVLIAAIRRLTDPEHADVLVAEPGGGLAVRRPRAELDSMTVACRDAVTGETTTWAADRPAIAHLWPLLAYGRVFDWQHQPPAGPASSFVPERLALYFRDGRVVSFRPTRGDAGIWEYEDNGRTHSRLEVVNPLLRSKLLEELRHVGVAPAEPRFIGESVTLFIDPGMLRVVGLYEFEGHARDGWLSLRYPITRDDGLGPARIEAVELRANETRKALPVHCEPEGNDYRMGLEAGVAQAYELEVRYSQPISKRSAKYLVTTARAWGRPLHRAWFQVIIDSTLGVPRFEMAFHEVGERPGFRRYLFDASPFKPERDLVVNW